MRDAWECQRCGRYIAVNYVSHECPAKDEAHAVLPSLPVKTFGERITELEHALRRAVERYKILDPEMVKELRVVLGAGKDP